MAGKDSSACWPGLANVTGVPAPVMLSEPVTRLESVAVTEPDPFAGGVNAIW